MSWDLMLMVLNIGIAIGAAHLFCTAPDWVQKISLGLLMLGQLFLIAFYAASAMGMPVHWIVRATGLTVCHLAIITQVIRLLLKESGVCRNSLPSSQAHRA